MRTNLIKSLWVILLMLPLKLLALTPVEGLIMGEVNPDYQLDPLSTIFKAQYSTATPDEDYKVRVFEQFVKNGNYLDQYCGQLVQSKYANSWDEKQAQRAVAASVQYVGLSLVTQAISSYAVELKMTEDEFKNLADNLVENNCSKNTTVYSLKLIKANLHHLFKTKANHYIPGIQSSPYASVLYKARTNTPVNYKNEMNVAVKNFRAFCSWGNDVADYRMMAPYLKNKYIMAFMIKSMHGLYDTYDFKADKVVTKPYPAATHVSCKNLICRKVDQQTFLREYPRSIGSIKVYKDLQNLYCHHFRYQDYKSDTIPQVKKWIKEAELEDPVLETNYFISLLTAIPDPTFGIDNYSDMQFVARSSFSDRWNAWAENVLGTFSTGLLFEESIKVKSVPQRDRLTLRTKGFGLNFTVTLGEMDRIMNDTDKFKVKFDLKITKNYLRHLVTKWNSLSGQVDNEGQKAFKKDIASYIEHQVTVKEKLFLQKMWNSEFSRLIADELLAQALAYKGPMFDSYQDELLTVPVNFSYGIFAISYLRYRSDVNAGRLKLNL
jgi:hypothetical protein